MARSVAGGTGTAGWRLDRTAQTPSYGGMRWVIRRVLMRAPVVRAVVPVLAVAIAAATPTPAAHAQEPRPASTGLPATDTLPADTLPADTTLSMRERALERLRAMRIDPVQPDPALADTALADSVLDVPADTAGADIVLADTILTETIEPDPRPGADPDEARPADPAPDRAPDRSPDPGRVAPTAPGDPTDPLPERASDAALLFAADTLDGDGPVMTEDSVRALLRALSGYEATEYTGQGAVYRADTGELELTGESRVGRGSSALSTDSLLVYDAERGVVCGYGTPVLSGERDPVESDELCFNIQRSMGVAVGARTQFEQGATWYVRGAENRVYLLTGGEQNTLYGENAEFTSCDLDHPHYTFRARSLKMVENDMMVASGITLEFEDVPVFWLPWMVQSMKRDRRSGLLMPEFGVNDIVRNGSGYNRSLSNLGFYWAINDYVSAKGTFEWYSNNWTAVEGAFTYRWLRQFLNGSVRAKQYWRQQDGIAGGGRREFTLNTANSWQPDERTRVQLNANYATSTEFVRNNSFDPRELNRRISSTASINRSFSWGSMSLGADRSEQLSTGQVDWKLPGLSLNISPITLFGDATGPSLTWNGSGNVTHRTRHVPDSVSVLDSRTTDASYSHSLSFGRLGLNQNVSWRQESSEGPVAAELPPFQDGLGTGPLDPFVDRIGGTGFQLGEESAERLGWSTSLSYQQTLWSGTTLSPSVSINGNEIRDERTDGDLVAEPYRLSAGASLNTSIFGFWPGFGDFSRIRHKIAPTLRWSYSPTPSVSPLQEQVFGVRDYREQNRLSLSFTQTFEAKIREDARSDDAGTDADTATGAVDTAGAADAAGAASDAQAGTDGEPRRLPQAEKVMLLALDTRTSFVYDFISARDEGRGFLTETIQNSVRSDLLRGFQLSMTHSLFETEEAEEEDVLAPRRFDPYLTDLSASFSIDNEFWLFDVLGLTRSSDGPAGPGGGDGGPDDPDAEGVAESDDPQVGAESDPDRSGPGSIIPGRGPEGSPIGAVGGWRAALNYSLRRDRPSLGFPDAGENQLLSGNVSFQPTQLWTLRWSTAYSITEGEFANHVLTLSRDLHRWQANFDFVKAQNGNFLFSFRVQLRDNPDLKLDYDQRQGPADRSRGQPVGGF